MVQALGNQLLAGAALSDHQHRAIERGGPARPLDRVQECQALADEVLRTRHEEELVLFSKAWQVLSGTRSCRLSKIGGFSAGERIWHGPCFSQVRQDHTLQG
jgi:hypothetical protein